MQTEKSQPEDKRMTPENEVYRVSDIIRWPDGWDFLVCIGDRLLIIFLINIIINNDILERLFKIMWYDGQLRTHSAIIVTARKWRL